MNRRTFLHLDRSTPAPSANAALTPYNGPWDRRRAAHLVRRTGFGASKRDVDRAFNDGSATAAVARLVETAATDPIPEAPQWYQRGGGTGVQEMYDLQRRWFEAMRTKGLVEKMTLFWHNHFSTQWSVNEGKTNASIAHLSYDHYKLLRLHALGNFKTLVRNVGLNPAMLVYLDGYVNKKGQANENYAREVCELFTMGQYDAANNPNYTEDDIKEIARAFTGWVVGSDNRASFDPSQHDRGNKTIFGQTDTFDYDGVIDLLFALRGPQTARFICRKIYCFFVQAMPDKSVISELAEVFLANQFEIAPVLQTLLGSSHFYDDTFVASRIKSPVEMLIGFLREAEVTPNTELLENMREVLTPTALNQELFNPPNVAGWPGLNPPDADNRPGHYAWLTTGTLPSRWETAGRFLYNENNNNYDPFVLAQKISDPSDPLRLATDLAETLLPVPLGEAGIHQIEESFGGNPDIPLPPDFLSGPAYSINLAKILLNGSPYYEWPRFSEQEPENVDEARHLLRQFIDYLIQLPEYQLT